MKVLLINKYLFPKGGDSAVSLATADLLKKRGHKVVFFSMKHPNNYPSEFEKYFVSNVDLNKKHGIITRLKTLGRIIYSFEAKKKIKKLIEAEKPDVAHLHNFHHHISPSIIDELNKQNIPIVMTLHYYKLTCPYYYHLNSKDEICEKCKNGYYNVLLNRCTKGSYSKSFANMVEMYIHHNILNIYKKVDLFISPSKFLIEKTRELKHINNIVHLPNFIHLENYVPSENLGQYVIYFGRLSREKGLITLLNASKDLKNIKIKILGEGPLESGLIKKAKFENLNVEFLGHVDGEKLIDEIKSSLFAVVPSQWYENQPISILEAFAMAKPVVGSRIGGIPELVKDGERGLTFQPGNYEDLRKKFVNLLSDESKISTMGRNARSFVEKEFNAERHYQELIKIYEEAINKRKNENIIS